MSNGWFYEVMGDELGPVSSSELKKLVASTIVAPDTIVRPANGTQRVPAFRIKGLFNETGIAAEPTTPSQPATELREDVPPNPPSSPAPSQISSADATADAPNVDYVNFVPSPPHQPTSGTSNYRGNVNNDLKIWGMRTSGLGLFLVLFFGLLYDTTNGEVYNIGQQQNRLIGFIFAMGVMHIGIGILLYWVHRVFPPNSEGSDEP